MIMDPHGLSGIQDVYASNSKSIPTTSSNTSHLNPNGGSPPGRLAVQELKFMAVPFCPWPRKSGISLRILRTDTHMFTRREQHQISTSQHIPQKLRENCHQLDPFSPLPFVDTEHGRHDRAASLDSTDPVTHAGTPVCDMYTYRVGPSIERPQFLFFSSEPRDGLVMPFLGVSVEQMTHRMLVPCHVLPSFLQDKLSIVSMACKVLESGSRL